MKKIKLPKIIGVCVFLCVLVAIIIQPENIIRNRIKCKFQNEIMSLSNVEINNSSEITFQLHTYECRPMNIDDGQTLSDFIDCIKTEITQFDEILILLNNNLTLLSIKMKKNNDGIYISEFNCKYAEVYTDVLSCFDLSKTEKMVYRGEAIASYESIFSQMKQLKRLSISCNQSKLADDLEDLVESLPNLVRLDFYVTCENKADFEKILGLRKKYPNIIISYHQYQ